MSNICVTGKSIFTIHSKITNIGEGVVSLHFHPIAFAIVQLKGHSQFSLRKHSCQSFTWLPHFCYCSVRLDEMARNHLNLRNKRVRGFFVFPNPPELNQNYPIRPEVSTTREIFESFGQIFI